MIKYLFYEPFVFLLLVLASCQSSVNMVPITQQKSSITKTSDGSVKDEYSISIVDIERYMELCGRNVKHLIRDCRLMFSIRPKQPTDPIHFCVRVTKFPFYISFRSFRPDYLSFFNGRGVVPP